MIESLIVRGIILCLVAGFVVYVLICACAELMGAVMKEDEDNDTRGGE